MITRHLCLTTQCVHKCDEQQRDLTFPTEADVRDDFYSLLYVLNLKSYFQLSYKSWAS